MAIRIRNGKYVIDYYPHGRAGKRVVKTLPEGTTEEEALIIERGLRGPSEADPIAKAFPSVSELFPSYLNWMADHKQPTYLSDVKWTYNKHFLKHLGGFTVEEIGKVHLDLYKSARKKDGVSPKRINNELYYFAGFLRWAEREKKRTVQPLKIEAYQYTRPLPNVLSPDEVARLLDAAEPFYRAFFLVLYRLGLRYSEAARLRWADLNEGYQAIIIRKAKGNKTKILPVDPELWNILMGMDRSNEWIFPSPVTGKPMNNVRKALARAAKKAGINKGVYPHLLRHSMATHLLDQETNLRVIQSILGHSKVSTTEFYTQVSVGAMRNAMGRLTK